MVKSYVVVGWLVVVAHVILVSAQVLWVFTWDFGLGLWLWTIRSADDWDNL